MNWDKIRNPEMREFIKNDVFGRSFLSARNPDYFRYVDPNVSGSGVGTSWDTAFKTITEGITELNTMSGKGATLFVAPGFYMEEDGIELSANDCAIVAVGLPEDTVLFGTGTAGEVAAADDHLLKISGGNNYIAGLSFYVHKDDKSSIIFDDTGAGYHGSFNIIENCYFSPQAQDGAGYGIYFDGGNCNIIKSCKFEGAKVAGIYVAGNVGNPSRNEIKDNWICGTAVGIKVASACYNLLLKGNIYAVGSLTNENMADGDCVDITAGFTAGLVLSVDERFQKDSEAKAYTNGGAGDLIVVNPLYGSSV